MFDDDWHHWCISTETDSRGGTQYKSGYRDVPQTWVAKSGRQVHQWVPFFSKTWYFDGSIFQNFLKFAPKWRKFQRKILIFGTWMGRFSFKMGTWMGGISKIPAAHPYPDQSWVPPPGDRLTKYRLLRGKWGIPALDSSTYSPTSSPIETTFTSLMMTWGRGQRLSALGDDWPMTNASWSEAWWEKQRSMDLVSEDERK